MKDEWIIGQSVDGERDYVVHLHPPRFIVEFVESDVGELETGGVDLMDPADDREIDHLLREAMEAYADWEDKLEMDNDN